MHITLVWLEGFVIMLLWHSQQWHYAVVYLILQKFTFGITTLSTLKNMAVRFTHFQLKYCSSIFLINEFQFRVHSIKYLKFKPAIKSIKPFIIQLSNAFPSLSFLPAFLGILSMLEKCCKDPSIRQSYFSKFMFRLPFLTIQT